MNALITLIDLIFRLATLLFLVRFFLQVSNADYHNSLSQAIIKLTDKVAGPVRRLVKPYRQCDLASLLLAYLISLGFFLLISMLLNNPLFWSQLAISSLARTLEILLGFYWWSILITIFASLFAQQGVHPSIALLQQIVDPLLAPARRLIPALGPMDFSPVVVLFLLSFFQNFLKQGL